MMFGKIFPKCQEGIFKYQQCLPVILHTITSGWMKESQQSKEHLAKYDLFVLEVMKVLINTGYFLVILIVIVKWVVGWE